MSDNNDREIATKYESRSQMGNAVKNDAKKPRMSLLPPLSKILAAKVMTYGAEKYSEHNWCEGFQYSVLVDAAQRHIDAWICGEDTDRESGLPHLAHAITSLMMLLDNTMIYGDKYDDRWKDAKTELGKQAYNKAIEPYSPSEFIAKLKDEKE